MASDLYVRGQPADVVDMQYHPSNGTTVVVGRAGGEPFAIDYDLWRRPFEPRARVVGDVE